MSYLVETPSGLARGHKVERRKPAFLDDVKFLLIGPAWVLATLMRRLRIPC